MRSFLRSTAVAATVAATVAVAVSLTACGHHSRPASYPAPVGQYPNAEVGVEYGRVGHIESLSGRGQSLGAGAVIGAVVGGVLGNQVGKGSGRAAATAVGVIGGAAAGHTIEGRTSGSQSYRVHVDLDRGGQRVYEVPHPGDLRVGDRVRVDGNGQISRY